MFLGLGFRGTVVVVWGSGLYYFTWFWFRVIVFLGLGFKVSSSGL